MASNKHQSIIPRQDKVVVVIGTTGTGKSRLAIELATRFNGEIINSDKIQVYKGLDIIGNKVTDEECHGVPHHLLGIVDPKVHFTAHDFVYHASLASEAIIQKGRLPIIAGGSNSYIKALVVNDNKFRSKYDCCFLWVDVAKPVLHSVLAKRVDQMLYNGLVDEAREFFEPRGDYSWGIRRAIGVPEMDEFFRNEFLVDKATRARLLEAAIEQIKINTCNLASRQFHNILRLGDHLEGRIHRIDATEVFLQRPTEVEEALEKFVVEPSVKIVKHFLCS